MEYKFSQLFKWTSGKPVTATSGTIPIYGANGIIGYTDTPKYENKIIIGRVGAYCGAVNYCKSSFNATDNTLITSCDETRILYSYAYYILMHLNLNNYSGGAAQPLITQSILSKLKCNIPPLPIQRRIASILSAYDTLIENNTRRIILLEQMAENLYKEWFVRFRFPGHEIAEFENGLPKGWKRDKIKEFYTTCSGGTPSREKEEYYADGKIPWVKTGEIKDSLITDTEEHITELGLRYSSAKILQTRTLLMAMYGVNIGMLGIITQEMACNQAACAFFDKGMVSTLYYLFYTLKTIREYLLSISFGAAQQNLSQTLIQNLKIIMPSESILHKFDDKISSIYEQIENLKCQNQLLTRQRDLLLPRLMSGKLEVKA